MRKLRQSVTAQATLSLVPVCRDDEAALASSIIPLAPLMQNPHLAQSYEIWAPAPVVPDNAAAPVQVIEHVSFLLVICSNKVQAQALRALAFWNIRVGSFCILLLDGLCW